MIKVLIDETRKVIGYYGTNVQIKTVDDIPDPPSPKVGINHVAYYDEEQNKVVHREVQRELTNEEKIIEQMKRIEKQQLSTMEVVATIVESQGSV